jgi:hypothetical protein
VEVLTVRRIVIVVLVMALGVGFGFARNSSSGFGPEGLDELEKQKGQFKTTLINPDADFAGYSKLCPKRVLLQFRGSGPAQDEKTMGSLVRKKNSGPAIPEGEDVETLRQVVSDAFASEMGSCEIFELVNEADPETLYVRVMIADIVTDIAKKSSKSEKPFSAQGTIIFDLIDAETGIIQARFSEHSKSKKAKDPIAPPETGAQWVNIWTWVDQAATELRLELERIRSQD